MSRGIWIHRSSVKLSRLIGWRVAAILAFGLLSVVGMRGPRAAAGSQSTSGQAQDRNRLAAQRKSEEAQSLLMQGTTESPRLAIKKFEEALRLWRAINDRLGEAETLKSIGSVYEFLSEYQKAIEFFKQALTPLQAINDRNGEAEMLYHIGAAYELLTDYWKALEFFNQALPLWRAINERAGEASTLMNIGRTYELLGDYRKAIEVQNRALPLWRAINERSAEVGTLNIIGNNYYSLGERRKALEFYNQALALSRAFAAHATEAETLDYIGAVYSSLGAYQKALKFHNQALALWRSINDRAGEARTISDSFGETTTLNNIGHVYYSLGERQKALEFFNQALALCRAAGDRIGEAETLYDIARVKRDLGSFNEARTLAESSLKIIESVRRAAADRESRDTYLADKQGRYEFYIDLLMQMHGREPAKGHNAAALEASERARARSLIESLTEARADIRRGADPELLAQEKSLQQRLNARAGAALKLSASGAGEAPLAARRGEIDALIYSLQLVQLRIRDTSPRYAALTQPQPLNLAEFQRQALDADTLLLEYSLGEERSFLWAVTPTTINSYVLPKREEIEAAAKRVYALLSDAPGVKGRMAKPGDLRLEEAGGQYLTAAASLSRMLLGPAAGQLGKKRLLIVADGALHYIPFGALPDPNSLKESEGNWQPLLVEHEVVNLPSASTIAVLRRELAGRKPAAGTLAVLADPVFSRDDERIKPGASVAAPQAVLPDPLDESRARKLSQIAGGAPGELRIERLPFTRMEAEAIAALAPAGSVMKALDFEASRATATSAQLSQYRYVHFATHGLADSERPELSTIVLSLYDEQGRPQDGFLRAHEVYNLELPAELVTLSACETGLGKLTKGEGLVSLTRGFMYAGAARVVVSLWSVNDRATAELMTKFYRRMLVGGERPAAALRAAQVEMWREKRWEAPYYWAAFTLQGEWR